MERPSALLDLMRQWEDSQFYGGGRSMYHPDRVAEADAYVNDLKQGMIDQELMRRGIRPAPAPLEIPQQSNWQDTTGLGGRMAALVPNLPQAQQPAGQYSNPGLLAQALASAAGDAGALSQNQVTRNTGSGTYVGPMLESSGPLQSQPWYDEYVAAAQGGAPLPMVRGSGGTPVDKEKQAAYRQQRQATVDARQRNVQSNAVADRVARHQRMGIPDNGMFFDDLSRLQGMAGQQGNDPGSPLGFLMNSIMAGGQYAQGAMEGQMQNARQAAAMATEKMKLTYAAAIAILQNPAATPQEKAMAQQIIAGGSGMQMGPQIPSLKGKTPQEANDLRWQGYDEQMIGDQYRYENPDMPYNPTPLPPGQFYAQPSNPASLADKLNTLTGMSPYETKRIYEQTPYVGGLYKWLNDLSGYNPPPPPPRIQFQ